MKRRKPHAPRQFQALRNQLCLFCQAPSIGMGVFVPYDPARYGAPAPSIPGHTSVFCYGVCAACYGLPKIPERVETLLRQRAVAPWN